MKKLSAFIIIALILASSRLSAFTLFQCQNCPVGTYSEGSNKLGQQSCLECPEDYYCPGASNKILCPSGHYSTTTGATSVDSCLPCPVGSKCVVEESGNVSVVPCSGGEYSEGGTDTCTPCPSGYYCTGNSDKQECPSNTYSLGNASSCTKCPKIAGRYNDGKGHWKSCFEIPNYGIFKPSQKDTYITTNKGLAMVSGRYMDINVSCDKTTGNVTLTGTGRYMKPVKLVMTPNRDVITYEGDIYLNSWDGHTCY